MNLSTDSKRVSNVYISLLRLLTDNPDLKSQVVMVVVAVNPAEQTKLVADNRKLHTSWTTSINARLQCEVVQYVEKNEDDMGLVQRLAFFGATDVLLLGRAP